MHGLVNRSIQVFLRDTYGAELWQAVARDAALGFDSFEAMQCYDDRLTPRIIDAAARRLDRPREQVLEDLGTYLISHPNLGRLRRLLRFGGVTFVDFLHSLDEIRERAHLALPDLDVPQMRLRAIGADGDRLHPGHAPVRFQDAGAHVALVADELVEAHVARRFLQHLAPTTTEISPEG